MASLARAAVRLTARNARGFRTSSRALAAQNFTMPALSPTMTEGNIASWRVKEGEKFAAGDVLLEIETDKATMDVEAQEDGILMKIMLGDGSKAVQVGRRIAVVAEEGDDISSLEIPAEGPKPQAAAKEAAPEPSSQPRQEEESAPAPKKTASGDKPKKQRYPLLPSVSHLVKANGLDEAAVSEISATGPNGRLLKGDVLAYLGKINAKTPAEVSARFEHAAHLDLSNIKVAKAPEPKKAAKPAPAEEPVEEDSLVTLPVTLTAAIALQKKVNDTLGVFLPLSELIARAADVANDELPQPVGYRPSADELFNQVLGLGKAGSQGSRGNYLPQISALPPASLLQASRPLAKQPDIIDILAGPSRTSAPKKKTQLLSGVSTGPNLFSLVVPKTEETRAEVFLERIKLILEKEPGRLVL